MNLYDLFVLLLGSSGPLACFRLPPIAVQSPPLRTWASPCRLRLRGSNVDDAVCHLLLHERLEVRSPCQLVAFQTQPSQVGEVPKCFRCRAGHPILIQIEALQLDEVAELGGDRTRELIVMKIEVVQLDEVAEVGGDETRQPVVGKIEARRQL